MSKLIYSQTSTLIETSYLGIKNTDLAVNPVYYSIAFTGDGFLYTHGRKFRLFNVVENGVQGLSFSITNGLAGVYVDGTSVGTANVVQTVSGDGIVTATTSNGTATVSHYEFLTELLATSYGSATQIPIITVNKSGHITAISNSTTIDISKVSASPTTETGTYYPTAVTNSNLLNPVYHASLYFDGSGNLHANNLYIGNSSLADLYAPKSHVTVYATDSDYGHVKLSDSVDASKDTSAHIAATPKAVSAGVTLANQYALQLFAAQDAMVFIGTIQYDGTITSHNANVVPTVVDNTSVISDLDYKVGWTFRFTNTGTFNGNDVEVGDMLIAVKAKASNFNINDWTIIQTNISGALTATSTLNGLLYANNSRVVNALALSNGILKYDGTSLSFVNPNTTWRDIKVDSTSIGTNDLDLLSGTAISITNNNGSVTIGVNTATVLSAAASLYIEQGNVKFGYSPSALATLTIGDKLSLSTGQGGTYTLSHATGTAFTNKLGYVTTDSYGHVTGITEVSYLPSQYSLTFKDNAGNSILEYSGSAAKVLKFANGTDISITSSTNASNEIVLTPSITHKYRPVQFYATASSLNATSVVTNGVSTTLTLIGGDNVTLTNSGLPDGSIKIEADDTWRVIQAYKFQSNVLSQSSIGDSVMKFNNDFIWSDAELGIAWTEIDENGGITYVK